MDAVINWVECTGRWKKPAPGTEVLLTVTTATGEKPIVTAGVWDGKQFSVPEGSRVIAYAHHPHPFVGEEEIEQLI